MCSFKNANKKHKALSLACMTNTNLRPVYMKTTKPLSCKALFEKISMTESSLKSFPGILLKEKLKRFDISYKTSRPRRQKV